MPDVLNMKDIDDAVIGILDDLGINKFQQIAQTVQDYVVWGDMLKNDKMMMSEGIGIRRTLMTTLGGTASHVGLHATDNLTFTDHLATLTVPWRHVNDHWVYEVREAMMNRGRARVVDVVMPRETACTVRIAEEVERGFWAVPAADNDADPYGLPFWIVYNATTGFNGGLPGDHTSLAGVSLTANPTFKNYTANFTNISKADLIKKWRTAHRKIGFLSPVSVNDYGKGEYRRFVNLVNESTISTIEDLGEQQNENLGRDIASMDGTMVFKKNPIVWAPWTDDNLSGNFVYMLNKDTFQVVALAQDYLRRTGPYQAPLNHNSRVVQKDLTYNYVCVDRRRNALLATTDPIA